MNIFITTLQKRAEKALGKLTLLCFILIGCGDPASIEKKELPPVPDIEHHVPAAMMINEVAESEVRYNACQLWNLFPAPKDADRVFQLIDHPHLVHQSTYQKFKTPRTIVTANGPKIAFGEFVNYQEVFGRHFPARIPQLLFSASREFMAHQDGIPYDEARKKIDLNFPVRRDPNRPGIPSMRDDLIPANTIFPADVANWWYDEDEDVQKIQWNGMVDELEKPGTEEGSFPGAATGKPGSLSTSSLTEDLLKLSGDSYFGHEHLSSLRLISEKKALFSSENWELRAVEMRHVMSILNDPYLAQRSFEYQACYYALLQRFFAQLVDIKGVRGAPAMWEKGPHKDRVKPPQFIDMGTIPEENHYGIFEESYKDPNGQIKWRPVIIDEVWVLEQIEKIQNQESNIRIKGANTLRDKLFVLRSLVSVSAYRGSNIWHLPGEAFYSEKSHSARIDARFLKMGLGLLAVTFGTIMIEEIELDLVNARLNFINDNDPRNLALLIEILAEAVDSIKVMAEEGPNEFEAKLLSPKELDLITDENLGAYTAFKHLLSLATAEALLRLRNDPTNTDLNRSIALLNFRGLDHGYLLPHINLVGIEATRERIARENLFRHWMRKTEGDQGEALPEENSEEIFNTRIRPFNNSVSTTSTRPNRDPFALDKDYYQFSEFFKDLNPQNDAEDNNGETTPLLNSSGLSQEDLVNITNFLRNLYPEKNDENSAWNGALSEEEVKELGERMEKLFSPPPPSDTSEPSGGPSEP